MKEEIIKYLKNNGHIVIDKCIKNDSLDDYPDFAFKVGELIATQEADLGILICGTGIGMSIAANKVKKVRCAHVSNETEALFTRLHNNANVLAISAKNTVEEALKLIDVFISTEFSEEVRHIRRINKITDYEEREKNV